MSNMTIEFCTGILLAFLILFVNIFHMIYLIIVCKKSSQMKLFRCLLFSSSFAALLVAIWLIPFFLFRIVWSPDSLAWRFWSFIFHVVDTVQLYSFLLILTTTTAITLSLQRIFVGLTWLAPLIAYSPLLWLSSPYNDEIDHLPYRRLVSHVPWWILPVLYTSMYLVPICVSLILSSITVVWPIISRCYHHRKERKSQSNDHYQDMTELTSLIETVLNFDLEQSAIKRTQSPSMSTFKMSSSSHPTPSVNLDCSTLSDLSPSSSKLDRSLSYKASQARSFLLFDDLSLSFADSAVPLLQTPIKPTAPSNNEQPTNPLLFFLIACLSLLIHLPYVLFSLSNKSTFQLSTFIYLHWFGTLLVPLIYLTKTTPKKQLI